MTFTDSHPVPAEIFCDESGWEGENLALSRDSVFVHGSVHLELTEAESLVKGIRKDIGATGNELKSKQLLAPRNRDVLHELLSPTGPLAGNANVYIADKNYFIVGKIVDLLVEEEAHDRGVDIVAFGAHREIANALFEKGPGAVGEVRWRELLRVFNSLVRASQRSGGPKSTYEDFIEVLDDVRLRGTSKRVTDALALVWDSRLQAKRFESDSSLLKEFEPLIPSLAAVITTWRLRLGDREYVIKHDEQNALTEDARQLILDVSRVPTRLPGFTYPAVNVLDIELIKSESDPRIQLADIIAGAGRIAALEVIAGTESSLVSDIHSHLDHNGLWAPKSSLESWVGPGVSPHIDLNEIRRASGIAIVP